MRKKEDYICYNLMLYGYFSGEMQPVLAILLEVLHTKQYRVIIQRKAQHQKKQQKLHWNASFLGISKFKRRLNWA